MTHSSTLRTSGRKKFLKYLRTDRPLHAKVAPKPFKLAGCVDSGDVCPLEANEEGMEREGEGDIM